MPPNLGLFVASVTVLLVAVAAAVVAWSARSPRRGAAPRGGDALVEAMGPAVVVFDVEGRVVRANPRWYELVGRPATEVLGAGPPYPWDGDEEHLRRPDGSLVPVLATTAPVVATGDTVAVYLDMTDRRKVEDALAEQNATLDRDNE